MAWKPADFAAFIRNENARAYLTGTALAAMHQMEHVAKAGVAKKAIIADSKVYFGGDEKATAAGLKSQLDAMANNWVVAGDVLRLLTPDDRASLRRQQVKGAVATMVDIMTDHMAKLGFASFTYAQFRDHIRYADKAAMDADLADKAAAEAERQQAVAEAEPQAAAEAATEPETVSEPVNTAIDEPIVGVDLIMRQVSGLSDVELLELANRINELMVLRTEIANASAFQLAA